MKYKRIYDEAGRLQCRGCNGFQDATHFYQRGPTCKACLRASPAAIASRAKALLRYASDPVYRRAKIRASIARNTKNKALIKARRRAQLNIAAQDESPRSLREGC